MSGKIITISRQFGSGGRTVGRMAADRLGFRCYDREIIQKIAEKSGFAEDYISEAGEYVDDTGFFGALGGLDFYGHSNHITIWTEQCAILKKIADEGPCVIVGRCADYVLKEYHKDLLKCFIYADMDSRAERIVRQYGESDVNPKKRLKDKDKRRAAYYDIYTDQTYGDPVNYDLCLNTGTLGIDQCVDIIVKAYQRDGK